MNFKNSQINIQDKEISLRTLNEQDAVGRWWQWFNDKEVTKFMNKGHHQNTPEKQLEREMFQMYKINKKNINRKAQNNVLNIDKLEPQY